MTTTLLILVSAIAGGLAVLLVFRRFGRSAPVLTTSTHSIAERVRAVGKLVGLEVQAKEIATSTKGWSWLPQIILSQAKVAMIFHFEKQYAVDLARLGASDVEPTGTTGAGRDGYRLRLPSVDGTLRLTDLQPYDIQAGRVLGLIDVIQMDAPTQHQLMKAAQEQAASLFTQAEPRYLAEAKRAIERQLRTLLAMFNVDVEIIWADGPQSAAPSSLTDTRHGLAIPTGPARQAVASARA